MRAHIRDGVVTELLQETVTVEGAEGKSHVFGLADRYAPAYLADTHPVPLEQEPLIAPGWTCIDGVFAQPAEPAPVAAPQPPTLAELQQRLSDLQADIAAHQAST